MAAKSQFLRCGFQGWRQDKSWTPPLQEFRTLLDAPIQQLTRIIEQFNQCPQLAWCVSHWRFRIGFSVNSLW